MARGQKGQSPPCVLSWRGEEDRVSSDLRGCISLVCFNAEMARDCLHSGSVGLPAALQGDSSLPVIKAGHTHSNPACPDAYSWGFWKLSRLIIGLEWRCFECLIYKVKLRMWGLSPYLQQSTRWPWVGLALWFPCSEAVSSPRPHLTAWAGCVVLFCSHFECRDPIFHLPTHQGSVLGCKALRSSHGLRVCAVLWTLGKERERGFVTTADCSFFIMCLQCILGMTVQRFLYVAEQRCHPGSS